MKNLKISRRLGIGFLVVVLNMVVLTAVGVTRVEEINTRLSTINDQNSVKQRYAINFRGSVHDRSIAVRDIVLAHDKAQVDTQVDLIAKLTDDYNASAEKMEAIFADPAATSDEEKAAMAGIKAIEAKTLPQIKQIIELNAAGDNAAATALVEQAAPNFTAYLKAINVFIDLEEAMNQGETAKAREVGDGFLLIMLLLCALATAIAVAIGLWITRGITRPLAEAGKVLAAVADGDLTRRMENTSKDEVGQMGESMNKALSTLTEVMNGFSRSTDGLSSISDRIGGLSARISSAAEESAAQAHLVATTASEVSASVQTVAAGSEEMGSSINEISHNATEAATVAERAVTTMEATTATVSQLGETQPHDR